MKNEELKKIENFLKENESEIIKLSINITSIYNKKSTHFKTTTHYYIITDNQDYNKVKSIYGTIENTTKGYGYDKESTAISTAINYFKNYITKRVNEKAKNTPYGLYKDKTISYGIGTNATMKAIKFLGYKVNNEYFGEVENNIKLNYIRKPKTDSKKVGK